MSQSVQTLIAFDSNVLTAFLNANSKLGESVGDDLASFRLFLYAPELVILPTVTIEAERIPKDEKREEHLKWVWYHFREAQLDEVAERIHDRARELLAHHSERDIDDCRLLAEAEMAHVDVLSTIDKRIKRLQRHTAVQLLTPARTVEHLGIVPGAYPSREPGNRHPHAGATWWRI